MTTTKRSQEVYISRKHFAGNNRSTLKVRNLAALVNLNLWVRLIIYKVRSLPTREGGYARSWSNFKTYTYNFNNHHLSHYTNFIVIAAPTRPASASVAFTSDISLGGKPELRVKFWEGTPSLRCISITINSTKY